MILLFETIFVANSVVRLSGIKHDKGRILITSAEIIFPEI
jgi:hypothetical protein